MNKRVFYFTSIILLLPLIMYGCQFDDESKSDSKTNNTKTETYDETEASKDENIIYTTDKNFSELINTLSHEKKYTITIIGNITSENISEIKQALKKRDSLHINLDLSKTTGLTSIEECAFECHKLISIKLPNTINSIGYSAFSGCTNLTNIEIPDSVTSICMGAFEECRKLESIRIPNSATLGDEVFYKCINLKTFKISENHPDYSTDETKTMLLSKDKKQLIAYPSATKDINIPDYITSIGNFAFSGCCNLENINFHNHIASIGENAFYDCQKLTNIELPDSVKQINDGAFSDCENLTSIKLPANITSINKVTFHGCKSLKNITLPNRLESIGEKAFYDCANLINIKIPDSVKNIGIEAFSGCHNLKEIKLPKSLESIDNRAFYECHSLESITIPDTVTSIGKSAFSECTNLKKIKLPKSLTTIKLALFKGCETLTSVTIPVSVTTIEKLAFMNCDKLTTINYTGTKENWEKIEKNLIHNEVLNKVSVNYNYIDK